VKAAAFDYVRVQSVAEAVAVLEERGEDARILAGGQSLIPALNMRLAAPELLVDITRITELRGISVQDGRVRIGALTRHVELKRSAEVAEHVPLLTMAIEHVAHAAVRNRGTIGGSIANADPASELPACALALEATMVVEGRGGTRQVPADDFFLGLFETAIAPSEILTAIEFRIREPGERSAFAELARRQGDYALAGIAAHGQFDKNVCRRLRLVFFGVGPTPILARAACERVNGRELTAATVVEAQDALALDLDPPDDVQGSSQLRCQLARVLLGRVAQDLARNSIARPG
jgi:carbon-monoxide dehydrogenase medium subunit